MYCRRLAAAACLVSLAVGHARPQPPAPGGNYSGPAAGMPVVEKAQLARGEVLVQLCEDGIPARNVWPDQPPKATETYREDCFGFFEVPHKYVDTGVRGDRPNPYLFRAA